MECTRPDISERIVMALYPEDFPKEQQEIQEHVKDCSACRKELEMLQSLQEAIREHRNQLVGCLSDCPTPAEIVEFSLGKTPDPSVQRHMECCTGCREEVYLVQQLHDEDLSADRTSSPSAEEKLIIRNTVVREYGRGPTKPSSSLSSAIRSFFAVLHVPSMALGAVAAALIVVVLVPWTSRETPSRLVLGDARWESMAPQTMTKGGDVLTASKKVAVILLIQDGAGLSVKEAAELYNRIDLGQRLGEQYELISPIEIKKALDNSSAKVSDVTDATRLVFDKMDVDYVLAFRIGGWGSQANVAGSLFERPGKKLLGFASWDGIPKGKLSEKVILIGAELLSGAEQS